MSLPLSDLKVVDYCQGLAGPNASMLMADQGANVIKIEPPGRGPADDAALNLTYLAFNRNKRSILLDINKPQGRELFLKLIKWADVFVTNMRIKARSRRDITYEDLAAINPKLIYASLTAFGDEGPEADLPGYDITVQARVGDMESRRPADGPPFHMYIFHYDMGAAILLFCGSMVALHERERTGRGQKVEVSLLQTALALQASQMVRISGRDDASPVRPPGLAGLAVFPCSDGRYMFLYSLAQQWIEICRSLGLEHLISDPRFDTVARREQNIDVLRQILSERFLTKPAAEWEAALKADEHVTSMVRKISEVFDDPQVIANQMIIQFAQTGLGTVTAVNAPFNLPASADEPRVRKQVPRKGEHTGEVLRELGYTPEAIEGLKAEAIIG